MRKSDYFRKYEDNITLLSSYLHNLLITMSLPVANTRIDVLTEEIKSLKKTTNIRVNIIFTRFFKNYVGSMWWMLQFYESNDQTKKDALEREYKYTFPDSLSNGDLLVIGKFIDQWTGYEHERTPGWIYYMSRLQGRVKIARDNVKKTTLRLKFEKAGVDRYIIPDLSNIVRDYFVAT